MTASGTLGLYPKFRADDADGLPLEGGRLYSYLSNTSTPQALYADAELTTALANPLVLDSSGEALYYYGPFSYKLALHDAQDVPQWVIDPVPGTGGGAAAAGIGLGSNTVELRPGVAAQAQAVVFPVNVLALGLTVWVSETFGTSQGLTHLGIGTPAHPDCWGVLTELTADTQTHAGVFLAYGGQPIPADGTVTLTAYGGGFDGTGAVYLTGHFATFAPSHALGLSWTPPGPPSPSPPDPQPYASETAPGVIELIDATEVLQDTDTTRALTIGRLVSRTGTPTQLGLLRTTTPATVLAGTNDTDAVTPAGLAAKLPAGTAYALSRYGASGETLETAPLAIVDSAGRFGFGTGTPLSTERSTLTSPALDEVPLAVVATSGSAANHAYAARLYRRTSNDMADNFGVSVGFHIADTALVDNVIGSLSFRRQGADNSGRFLVRTANAGVLGGNTVPGDLAVDPAGNVSLNVNVLGNGGARVLALGSGTAPASSAADAVQLWSADRNAIAGRASLHVRTETGASHVLGDIVGLGTLATGTLGSGASYAPLSVNGNVLTVGMSTVQERPIALLASTFAVATDATRTGRLVLSAYDSVGAREALRIEADGTAARVGFYGSAAVVKPTVTGAKGGNAALGSLLTALSSLGLVTDSSTA